MPWQERRRPSPAAESFGDDGITSSRSCRTGTHHHLGAPSGLTGGQKPAEIPFWRRYRGRGGVGGYIARRAWARKGDPNIGGGSRGKRRGDAFFSLGFLARPSRMPAHRRAGRTGKKIEARQESRSFEASRMQARCTTLEFVAASRQRGRRRRRYGPGGRASWVVRARVAAGEDTVGRAAQRWLIAGGRFCPTNNDSSGGRTGRGTSFRFVSLGERQDWRVPGRRERGEEGDALLSKARHEMPFAKFFVNHWFSPGGSLEVCAAGTGAGTGMVGNRRVRHWTRCAGTWKGDGVAPSWTMGRRAGTGRQARRQRRCGENGGAPPPGQGEQELPSDFQAWPQYRLASLCGAAAKSTGPVVGRIRSLGCSSRISAIKLPKPRPPKMAVRYPKLQWGLHTADVPRCCASFPSTSPPVTCAPRRCPGREVVFLTLSRRQ